MSLTRNTLYNIGGASASIVVALVTIPPYLHQIGEVRYGVLALVWLLLGYFGLFDLGLSRATANYIARLRDDASADREAVFWTAIVLNIGLGVVGAVALYFAGGPALWHWLKMTPGVHAEAVASLPWIAGAVPVATSTAVMTGALIGKERFGAVNLVQVGGMILFLTVPLIVSYAVGPQLSIVIPAAVLSRCAVIAPLFFVVKKLLPLSSRPHIRREKVRELLGYGAWVSVTNIIGPILHTFDRFFVGAVIGAAAVAFYDVPFRLVSKLEIVSDGLSQALFPRLSSQSQVTALRTARDAVAAINGCMTPMVVVALLCVSPFLTIWVGATFAQKASPVGVILLLGVWTNSLAAIPFAKLQAEGRPDWVAKAHALELVPYLAGLWWALHHFGLVGAASVWSVRVTVDSSLLFWFSRLGRKMIVPLLPSAGLICFAWALATYQLPVVVVISAGVVVTLLSFVWGLVCSSALRATGRAAYISARRRAGRMLTSIL